jgi:uncharacterized protein HemX
MGRAIGIIVAVVFAAAAGIAAGFWLWGRSAQRVPTLEQRAHFLQSESSALQSRVEDFERRLDLVTKEQERLAQENTLLRQQLGSERLLGATPVPGAPTPTLPPK